MTEFPSSSSCFLPVSLQNFLSLGSDTKTNEMLGTNLSRREAWLTTPQSRYMQTVASVSHMLFRTGPACHCSRALWYTVSARILLCTVVSEWVGRLGIEPTACMFATTELYPRVSWF